MSHLPEPGPGHQRLAALAGTWEGEETMHPSRWDPAGGTATGRNRLRLDLNGFALITDYEQERDGAITFTGHGVTTYDPSAPGYLGSTMDMAPDGEAWQRLFEARYERVGD